MTGRTNLITPLTTACVLLFLPAIAAAVERYVPGQYPTIQDAINAAVDGDTVIVAPGTYTGNGNRDLDFLGKAITVRSTDPNDPNIVAATIIDCNGTESNLHRGFYFHNGEDANSILSGFTITNGYVENGGGIYCYFSSPMISNCTVSGNTASMWDGGGIYCLVGNPTITNCTFSGNSANSYGGGLDNWGSSPIVTNCIFNGNSSPDGGGALSNYYNSNPTITNCTFSGNSASDYGGGGIYNYYSSPTVTNCTFNGNSASVWGGGMYNINSSPIVSNCTFSGNRANQEAGGGMYNVDSSPAVFNCTFSNNFASIWGGGMFNELGSPAVENCIFWKNSASIVGGGMFNAESNLIIECCTFVSNRAGSEGGGLGTMDSNSTLTNCILWGNSAPHSSQISSSSGTAVNFSDVRGGWAGIGNINIDPRFVNAAAGNLHLLPASPCINAGDPNFIPGPDETDIDGEPRVMLARVDMGADEFNPFEIDFTIVNKRRIGRTLFEYDCTVTLTNISNFTVSNVSLEIIDVSENMLLIDPSVTFGNTVIAPGQSAASLDMCTFQIDRSQPTDPAKIIWQSTCEIVDGVPVPGAQDIASGIYLLNLGIIAGDFNLDNKVDLYDLNILADQWLLPPGTPSADIAPLPAGDDLVDFLDFAVLAQNWLRTSSD